MPYSFLLPIRTAAPHEHRERPARIREYRDQSGLAIGEVAQRLDHLRRPETESIDAQVQPEVEQGEQPDARTAERFAQRGVLMRSLIACNRDFEDAAFLIGQPACLGGRIAKLVEDHD